MTTEQKLERCLEFLDKLERLDFENGYRIVSTDDVTGKCNECGSTNIDIDSGMVDGHSYIDTEVFDNLKDMIWHVKADITD